MPAPGDQHKIHPNPFEEAKTRVSEYTAGEIATLQSRLEKQLGPEYLSSRSGPSGAKVHYIAAEKCISLANEVFGFNGWSSSIQNIQVDFVDENPQTSKVSLGLSVIMRVTLKDGTFHEDIGYGHIENCKGKAAAFEKAKKEGTTDAMKRALRNFGNVLGNCIYDKEYLAKVSKMKFAPTKLDEGNLYRHSDFAKKDAVEVKSEPEKTGPTAPALISEGGFIVDNEVPLKTDEASSLVSADTLDDDFGDFDMADFGVTEDGHPDEVVLPAFHGDHNRKPANPAPPVMKPMQPPPPPKQPQRPTLNNNQPPRPQPQTPTNYSVNRSVSAPQNGRPQAQQPGRPPQARPGPVQANNLPPNSLYAGQQAAPNNGTAATPTTNDPPSSMGGFFSARSADILLKDIADDGKPPPLPPGANAFNPHADSPSIRRTPGIDHRTSKPLGRNGQHVAPKKQEDDEQQSGAGGGGGAITPSQSRVPLGNVVNPSLNSARQIGAPGGAGSPMGNRGQFRPLSVKRPAPVPADSGSRVPLTEMTTNGAVGGGEHIGEADAKRLKTG